MPIERLHLAAAIAILAGASGCAENQGGMRSMARDNWGEANRQTMAAQVIDPNPQYDSPLMTTGVQVAAAQARLRTDTVKQPERTRTSGSSSSGTK